MADTPFHFGKNWQAYLAGHVNEASLRQSTESLKRFLPFPLSGKSFADVGSGSGVHSLSALELGASRVTSFDADADSVAATEALKKAIAPDADWTVRKGSMLDADFVSGLGSFDLVYCWGVAHHTGDMWKALATIDPLVAKGGHLYVALYNTVGGRIGSSAWWHSIKKFYNRSPRFVQKLMERGYISLSVLMLMLRFRNPFTVMRDYRAKRGMAYTTDRIDWLGGYPYEHAKPEEVFHFYAKRGMELVEMKTTNYVGCNEFLFRRP